MTEHIVDDLPLLLTGQATREATFRAAEHLRSCPDCQQELISVLVAHASLASAVRFAPEIATPPGDDDAAPLPDLQDVFAEAQDDAASGRAATRRRKGLLVAAAAAVVATGVGLATAELTGESGDSPSRTIALSAFDVGSHPAEARLEGGDTMRIDASALPRLDAGHFYEVWLTNKSRTRLQAIGSIGTSNQAVLTVSPNVMSQYSAIEVSVQKVDQTSYSGTSVARGTY